MDLMLTADPLQDLLKFLKGNKRENFQIVMMICICLGIHPEILFEFMHYVPMNRFFLKKLKMITLGGFFYRKLLSSLGFIPPYRERYLLSLRFKKVTLAKMLETCGCRLLPLIFQRPDCKDIPMLHYASAFSFLRCSRMKVDHIFSRSSTELLLFKNVLSFLRCSRMKVDHISSMSPTELLLFENALIKCKGTVSKDSVIPFFATGFYFQ